MIGDGNWKIELHSPMGKQNMTFVLKSNGNEVAGTGAGDDGTTLEIFEGKVDGNEVAWKLKVTKPMPVTLKFTVTVDGDEMSGKVKPGVFPAFPVTGKRV